MWSIMMLAVHAQRRVLFSEGMWRRSGFLMQSQRLVFNHCVQGEQARGGAPWGPASWAARAAHVPPEPASAPGLALPLHAKGTDVAGALPRFVNPDGHRCAFNSAVHAFMAVPVWRDGLEGLGADEVEVRLGIRARRSRG